MAGGRRASAQATKRVGSRSFRRWLPLLLLLPPLLLLLPPLLLLLLTNYSPTIAQL